MLYNALSMRKKKPKIAPYPWDCVTPAGRGPSDSDRQHAQKIGKDRAGSRDMLADRQTDR